MSGIEFYQTVQGKRFFEGTLPNLVKNMSEMNESLKEQNALLKEQNELLKNQLNKQVEKEEGLFFNSLEINPHFRGIYDSILIDSNNSVATYTDPLKRYMLNLEVIGDVLVYFEDTDTTYSRFSDMPEELQELLKSGEAYNTPDRVVFENNNWFELFIYGRDEYNGKWVEYNSEVVDLPCNPDRNYEENLLCLFTDYTVEGKEAYENINDKELDEPER